LAAACLFIFSMARAHDTAVGFFYGDIPSANELSLFDYAVVHAQDYKGDPAASTATVCSYLSLGEFDQSSSTYSFVPSAFLGQNEAWGTKIADQTSPAWRDYVSSEFSALRARGFNCFFLDTLDSSSGAKKKPERAVLQNAALSDTIIGLKQAAPQSVLMFNRGFDLLPRVGKLAKFIVAESLYNTFDSSGQYHPVSPQDSAWLEAKLDQAKSDYGLSPVVIDYVPSGAREQARTAARKIAARGYIPWVSDRLLHWHGTGNVEIIPRRILAVYDGAEFPQGPEFTPLHRNLEASVNYLGYTFDYLDADAGLPSDNLNGKYAGVVTWFTDNSAPVPLKLRSWMLKQLDDGVKVAIIGDFGFVPDAQFLSLIGIKKIPDAKPPLKISYKSGLIGFEAQPRPQSRDLQPYMFSGSPQLRLKDAAGNSYDAVMIGKWGGAALYPYFLDLGYESSPKFIVNPFDFISRALALEPFPVPDPSTENARRILTVHIDGDGAVSRTEYPPHKLSIEALYDNLLSSLKLPVTFSVIEGETGSTGLYPKLSGDAENGARKIFALGSVEAASHSYSHPFYWSKVESDDAVEDASSRLDIPGYSFNLERDINGSVDYINARLLPPGKKVKVFLWSGNALPDKAALSMTRKAGLLNVNGGNTFFVTENESYARVFPAYRRVGDMVQVYAPVQNENVYTNRWSGPYDGYARAMETFKFTEAPRRVRELGVYFHVFSASKKQSLSAVKEVLGWARKQAVTPLWLSEYASRVEAFADAAAGRTLGGDFVFCGGPFLRTLRIPEGLPQKVVHGEGVAGYAVTHAGTYANLFPPADGRVYVMRGKSGIRLVYANAPLSRWTAGTGGLEIGFNAHVPLEFAVSAPDGCKLKAASHVYTAQRNRGLQIFTLPAEDGADAFLSCR